ncbi:MAG: sigma-54 dependent transcriptional regulator [Spirochaetes bacterium]|nr:sigma-54 dependent transcriptional regulator [Spirochaetota bacterium]
MRVLIADDERNIRETLKRIFLLEGIEAVTAPDGIAARDLLAEERFDVAILDLKMPGMSGQEVLDWTVSEGVLVPVVMISAHGEIPDAVQALKSGARDFLEKPLDTELLLQKIRALVEEERRKQVWEANRRIEPKEYLLIGKHPKIEEIRTLVRKLGSTDSTVLITGETGTGKEIVARQIHAASPRKEEPFIGVNIGALPQTLIESELFGHEKGAFTGADSRTIGLFELAGAGTLFLDEIGEMPLPLQVKLLRVLQDRKIRRIGGNRDIPIRARILSATNRNLEERVRQGEFREDLFYRLNVIRIDIPPLRERKSDIPLISEYLLGRICKRLNVGLKRLNSQSLEKLHSYEYPGNVRELENILERAVILSEGGEILPHHIELKESNMKAGSNENPLAGSYRLEAMERVVIEQALQKYGGNRTKTAEVLGISRRALQYKIKKYGLSNAQAVDRWTRQR